MNTIWLILITIVYPVYHEQVLWPECGWQPVSLTDLITAASVKKFYRKATLCIHPDKVQQKGANLQQKYIAEKVFDLLKVHSKFYMEILFHLTFAILIQSERKGNEKLSSVLFCLLHSHRYYFCY